MPRFRTRTREVEAIQHENMRETTAWLNSIEDAEEIEYTVAAGTLLIVTGGKRRAILPGDWIVLDGNTLRLYAANYFDDNYEPAADDGDADELARKLAEATDAMRNLWAQSHSLMTDLENLATETATLGETLISLQAVIATTTPPWETNQ